MTSHPQGRWHTPIRVALALALAAVIIVAGAGSAEGAAVEPPPVPFNPGPYDEGLRRCGAEVLDGGCGDQAGAAGSLLGSAFGSDDIGRAGIPTGNYDTGYSDSFGDFGGKFFGGLTSLAFAWSKVVVSGTAAILRWAFGFRVGQFLAAPVQGIASDYHQGLDASDLDGPGGYDIAIIVCVFLCGYWALRNRTSKAAGELLLSLGIYAMALAFVLLVPNGFGNLMTEGLTRTGQTSGAIGAIALRHTGDTYSCPEVTGDGDLENVSCPFARALHGAVVERPYDLVNWGAELGSGGDPTNPLRACAQARDRILLEGPHGAADTPREMMDEAGDVCHERTEFNETATADRAVVATSNAVVASLVALLVLLIAMVLVVAQVMFAVNIALSPFALCFGLVPGSSRTLFWRWVSIGLKSLVTIVAVAVTLCIYLVILAQLLALTTDQPWFLQAFAMLVPEVLAFVGVLVMLYKLIRSSRRGAEAVGHRLSQAQVGGASHGGFVAAAAGSWAATGWNDRDLRHHRMAARRAHYRASNVYDRIRRPRRHTGGVPPGRVPQPGRRGAGRSGGRGEGTPTPVFGRNKAMNRTVESGTVERGGWTISSEPRVVWPWQSRHVAMRVPRKKAATRSSGAGSARTPPRGKKAASTHAEKATSPSTSSTRTPNRSTSKVPPGKRAPRRTSAAMAPAPASTRQARSANNDRASQRGPGGGSRRPATRSAPSTSQAPTRTRPTRNGPITTGDEASRASRRTSSARPAPPARRPPRPRAPGTPASRPRPRRPGRPNA